MRRHTLTERAFDLAHVRLADARTAWYAAHNTRDWDARQAAGEALDLASDTFNRVRARLVDQRTPCAGCGAFSERDYVCAPFRA